MAYRKTSEEKALDMELVENLRAQYAEIAAVSAEVMRKNPAHDGLKILDELGLLDEYALLLEVIKHTNQNSVLYTLMGKLRALRDLVSVYSVADRTAVKRISKADSKDTGIEGEPELEYEEVDLPMTR